MDALNFLLVDDDRFLATTLSHGLRKAMGKAISVVFCSSGPEAFALLATQSFDVVITDLAARMRLMDNHWYVDVQNVDPYKWMPLAARREPLSALQRLAILVAAVTLVVIYFGKPGSNFVPAAGVAVAIISLCIAADNIRKRRN